MYKVQYANGTFCNKETPQNYTLNITNSARICIENENGN